MTTGARHRERQWQTTQRATSTARADSFACFIDGMASRSSRTRRGSSGPSCLRMPLVKRLHLPGLPSVNTASSPNRTTPSAVGAGSMVSSVRPEGEWNHTTAHSEREKRGYPARHPVASNWVYALWTKQIDGGRPPRQHLTTPFSVNPGEALQRPVRVVSSVCLFKFASRQKQLQAHRKGRVGGLHLEALCSTSRLEAYP